MAEHRNQAARRAVPWTNERAAEDARALPWEDEPRLILGQRLATPGDDLTMVGKMLPLAAKACEEADLVNIYAWPGAALVLRGPDPVLVQVRLMRAGRHT